jgi:hypothetical protein
MTMSPPAYQRYTYRSFPAQTSGVYANLLRAETLAICDFSSRASRMLRTSKTSALQ